MGSGGLDGGCLAGGLGVAVCAEHQVAIFLQRRFTNVHQGQRGFFGLKQYLVRPLKSDPYFRHISGRLLQRPI